MAGKNISFSESLLKKGLISREQLDKALALQNKGRLLGSIAVELGLLAQEDVLKVQEYQEAHDAPFGEAAISLGFITASQLKFLLDVRLRKKIRIGDILVQEGFIEKEKLYDELMSFEKRRHRLEKILVCDSSEIVNSLLKKRLERYGYRVFSTESPSEALKAANREAPNLIIVGDIFSGLSELGTWTRNFSLPKFSETKIIFMAQDIDENFIESAFEMGIHHFLKKPVMEYELLNVIYSIEQETRKKREEKILVVEDSDMVRQIMVRELKQHGYTVFQAGSGEEALRIAKEKRPDLITMDILMPGIDGYETCRRLKNDPATREVPVIVVTTCNSLEEREKGFEAGAVEYFIKPFAPNQLADFINLLFETKKTRRKEKAVVMEDNPTTLHIIKHMLEKHGIEVVTALNGKQGLDKVRETMPDIALVDIYMPEANGFEVLRDIKKSQETNHIPCILLTGSRNKEELIKGLAYGASDFLVKPFDEEEFSGRVHNLLAYKKFFDDLKVEKEINIENTKVLKAINTVFHEAIICKTEEDLGRLCLSVAEEITGSKFGFFGEINEKGLFDTIAISNPGWEQCKLPEGKAVLVIKNMPIRGVDRATMKDGKARIVNGEDAIKNHPDHVEIPYGHPPITAFLGVPFIKEGKVIGMIGLGNKKGGYTIADRKNIEILSVALVEAFAKKRIELAIETHRKNLESDVEKRTIELREANVHLSKEVLQRKKSEEAVTQRMKVEKALSRIAKLFVTDPHPDFHLVLQFLVAAIPVNRAYIFLFREKGGKMDNVHEWCDAETESMKGRLQGLDTSAFPWWMARLEQGEAIMVSDVDALPEEAAPEREILKSQSILALLVVPVISPDKRLLGFLGFDDTEKNREWQDEDVQALVTAAEILSNYLARKEAEEKFLASLHEKELLLREINHRVNNNLHIISGLLSLQSEYLDEPKVMHVFQGCRDRIEMMAFIHEKLYKSENLNRIDFNDFIKHLAYYLSGTYIRGRNVEMAIEAEGVFMGIDTAIPCGLVIHELASNALRHAFPGDREGEVKIGLRRIADFGMRNGGFQENPQPELIELVVSDNGIGLPPDLDIRAPRFFGLRLAVNLAEKQLYGSVELNRENGTEFRIRFRERKYVSRMEGADQYTI